MKQPKITATKLTWAKKAGTKVTFIITEAITEKMSFEEFQRMTSDETCKAFRRLGSSQRREHKNTEWGYLCIRLVSVSPCKTIRHTWDFKFQ
jgi:hypothetical protein